MGHCKMRFRIFQCAALLLSLALHRGEADVKQANVHLDFVYHNYNALTSFLRNVSAAYPSLTHLYSIGKSVQGSETPENSEII